MEEEEVVTNAYVSPEWREREFFWSIRFCFFFWWKRCDVKSIFSLNILHDNFFATFVSISLIWILIVPFGFRSLVSNGFFLH